MRLLRSTQCGGLEKNTSNCWILRQPLTGTIKVSWIKFLIQLAQYAVSTGFIMPHTGYSVGTVSIFAYGVRSHALSGCIYLLLFHLWLI